ncbi:MAG: TetR/AcrR family transcriptional regulator C-terminal domain-containing protein, partial [Streptosporangiaceae bacterium]
DGAPMSRLHVALVGDEPAGVAGELRGIVAEIYDTLERAWPLLSVVERCAPEIPELETVWFGEGRADIYTDLTEYLRRRAASGQLRPMPDALMAAHLVGEMAAWSAWHRRHGYDDKLFDDQTARRTTIEFVCAALIPETAPQAPTKPIIPNGRLRCPDPQPLAQVRRQGQASRKDDAP